MSARDLVGRTPMERGLSLMWLAGFTAGFVVGVVFSFVVLAWLP